MWKGQNQRICQWVPYQGNGFEEHAMTSHRTTSNKCLVHVNSSLGPALSGHVYGYRLMGIPSDMAGTFTWCVRSFDAAGVASPRAARR